MRPLDNPYLAGAGAPPPFLAGREEFLAAIDLMFARAGAGRPFVAPLICGLRGTGKTIMLRHCEDRARDAGWVTVGREIPADRGEGGLREIMVGLTRRAVLAIVREDPITEHGSRLLRILMSFARSSGTDQGTDIAMNTDDIVPLTGVADSGRLDDDLADLLVALGEAAADRGVGVVFLFDELHNLSREDLEGLVSAFYRVSQQSLPIAVVGTALPQPLPLGMEAQIHAGRLFETWNLGTLDGEALALALTRPALDAEVAWSPEAIDALALVTGGWPYFVQTWAQRTWEAAASSPIVAADVARATPQALADLDRTFFAPRYSRASSAEQQYLAAMASLGDGPCDTAAVATTLNSTPQSMSVRRDGLLRKGLIYSPRVGQVAFAAPGVPEFLARQVDVDISPTNSGESHVDSPGAATRLDPLTNYAASMPLPALLTAPGSDPKDHVA